MQTIRLQMGKVYKQIKTNQSKQEIFRIFFSLKTILGSTSFTAAEKIKIATIFLVNLPHFTFSSHLGCSSKLINNQSK